MGSLGLQRPLLGKRWVAPAKEMGEPRAGHRPCGNEPRHREDRAVGRAVGRTIGATFCLQNAS